MTPLYIIAGVVVIIAIVISLFEERFNLKEKKSLYHYKKRNFFLTRAEHECFDVLTKAVGNEYIIFAQVHLPTIIDERINGQDWRASRAHVNRKSVDFVLCDKSYISPKLAIEVDDKTHERPDRQLRDQEVERILKEAGIPLLRITNHGTFNAEEIAKEIKETLSKV